MSLTSRTSSALLALATLCACSAEESPTQPVGNGGDGAPQVIPVAPDGSGMRRATESVRDLLLATRRERHVKGKPEWLSTTKPGGEGAVLAATHSPGAILIWRDPGAEPETLPVGDYPLRPVSLGGQLAVASRADRSLVFFDLSKPGRPEQRARHELPDVPMVIAAGVLEEDGGEELLVVTKGGQLLRFGGNEPSAPQQLVSSSPRCALVLESNQGLVVGFQGSDRLEYYRAQSGSDSLEHRGGFALPGTPRDLLSLDLDEDGTHELIAVEGDHGGWIFAGDWQDLESARPQGFRTTAIPLRLLPMEDSGRARWSLLSASSVACELWNWRAGVPQRWLFSYAGQTPRDMCLRDIDGDGRQDFWIANRDAHVISLLRNGDGGPIQPEKISVGTFPNDLATGDIDGDGLHELFVINAKDTNISVIGRRDGQMIHGYKIPTGPSPRAVQVGDVNGDGFQDLLWMDRTHLGTRVNLRIGDGSGALREPADFEPIAMGQGDRDFVIESFNGGNDSLVVSADQDGRRLLWTRVVLGGDQPAVFGLDLPGPPRSIATMFQGEVARGVAIAMQTAPDRSTVQIYVPIQNDQTLVEWRMLGEVSLAGAVIDLAAGDLDGDGIDDLAYLAADREGSVGGRVQPLLVKGGKPQALESFSTGLRPQRVLLDDFSGDGRAEVFVANLDSHNVNVWLSVAAEDGAQLRRLDDIGAGVGCIALASTDLDGDRDYDLIVVDSANDGVSLILNQTY